MLGLLCLTPQTHGQGTVDGQIAFFSSLADEEGIYLMNADGTNVHKVPNTSFDDYEPNISPDGTRIVVTSYRAGTDTDIFVINTDGTDITPLTSGSGSNYHPCWSPDGTQIAFISNRNGPGEVFIMNADGSADETPIPGPTGDVAEVDWSPDGSRLAIVLGHDIESEIWVMDPDGSNQLQLTDNSVIDDNPSFSSDGTQIAFRSNNNLGGTAEVYLMNSDGTNPTKLADGRDPTFSPDGTQIVFQTLNANLHKIDVDGTDDTPLTNNSQSYEPDWGPAAQAAELTVSVVGQRDGSLVRPNTGVELKAVIKPATAIPSIASVQFFVNNDAAGQPDTSAPFEYSTIVKKPGARFVVAEATDDHGKKTTSPPLHFTVADAAAGFLALQTIVEPVGTVKPGGFITYRMVVTNTSDKATANNVSVTAPIALNVIFETAEIVDAQNQPIKIPRPGGGKNPRYVPDQDKVEFYLGDIAPGKTRYARLKVRVPFDAHEGDDAIHSRNFKLSGEFGQTELKGTFADKVVTIAGVTPAKAPRLALAKGIVDKADDPDDDTDFKASGDTAVGLTTWGQKVSFALVATNYGGLPASRVSVKDRIPEGFSLVEGSVRINNKAPGGLFELNGRTMSFRFGDFAPHENVAITYQLRVNNRDAAVNPGPPAGALVESVGAEMHSENLRRGVDSAPERIGMIILPPAAMILEQPYAFPASSIVGEVQRYEIPYRNEGTRAARNVKIRQQLPPGTVFQEAYLKSAPGQKIAAGKDGPVIFDIGSVDPDERGRAVLVVKVTKAVDSLPKPGVVLPAATFVAPTASAESLFSEFDGAQANAVPTKGETERNRLYRPDVPRFGILKQSPKSVQKGDTFSYIVTVTNTSDFANTEEYVMPIPAGAKYESHSVSDSSSFAKFEAGNNRFRFDPFSLDRGQAKGFTIVLRATGDIGSRIVDDQSVFCRDIDAVAAPPSVTLIVEGDASAPDNQSAIEVAQLEFGTDASKALADPAFLARVRKIDANSSNLGVAGVDHIQLNNGGIVIPTGLGQMVAAGGGNLVAAGAGNLIGSAGNMFVYAGLAEQIQFTNLVGTDGSTLAPNNGAALIDQLVKGAAGNLVAAGAGNLVAAGAGNLVGLDGATLVGNDGGTFANVSSLVAAGGGNLVAAGGGNLAHNALATLISNGQLGLVAAGGGNLVAAGGGNLVGNDGASISRDLSRAMMIGLDGGTMVAAGAGNLLGKAGATQSDSAAGSLNSKQSAGSVPENEKPGTRDEEEYPAR